MINYSKNENVNVSVGFRVCSKYCDLKSVGRGDLLTYRRNQSSSPQWGSSFGKLVTSWTGELQASSSDVKPWIVKYPLFLSDFIETWIFRQMSKNTQVLIFMKIRRVGADFFDANGQRTDMTEPVVGFHNFVSASKMRKEVVRCYCLLTWLKPRKLHFPVVGVLKPRS
jgi:hypothetical protein